MGFPPKDPEGKFECGLQTAHRTCPFWGENGEERWFDEIGNRITALKGTSQAKWEENELEIFALNKLANVSKASYSEMRS